jgi:hypothetical protein
MTALKEAWAKVAKDEGDQDYFFRFVLDDIDRFRAAPEGAESAPPEPIPSPAPQGTQAQTAQP